MKILEYMSFDPSWLTTLPGILITGGVVLLLIALIILLASGKKDKDESENVDGQTSYSTFDSVQDAAVQQPVQQEEPVNIEVPTFEQPVSNVQAAPQVEIFEPNVVNNNVKEPEPLNIEVPNEPVQTDNSTVPGVLNIETPQPTSDVAQVEIPQTPISQPEPEKKEVSIYGGVSPSVNLYNEQPVKPVIYGGADPLENTAPIPKVEKPVEEVKSGDDLPVSPLFEARPVEATPVDIPVSAPTSVIEKTETPIPDISAQSVSQPTQPSNEVEEMETLDF